jgi:hypothetical protein
MSIKGVDFFESGEIDVDFEALNDEKSKAILIAKLNLSFIK